MTSTSWTSERARIAAISRGIRAGERPADDPALPEARRNLAALKLEEHIQNVLDKAPEFTDEQRTKLAELLKPAREAITAARLAELADANGG